MARLLVLFISFIVRALRAAIRSRANLVVENVALRAAWPRWTHTLIFVKTDTVAKWHRNRFRRHWTMISRQRHPGRPRINATIGDLIGEIATDGWGAPRLHGGLLKLGTTFDCSHSTSHPRADNWELDHPNRVRASRRQLLRRCHLYGDRSTRCRYCGDDGGKRRGGHGDRRPVTAVQRRHAGRLKPRRTSNPSLELRTGANTFSFHGAIAFR